MAIFTWCQFEQDSIGQGMAVTTIAITISLLQMLAAIGLMQRQVKASDLS
ncbi:hypothetical protein SD961_04905 [Erwinia sp. MMLR14_017]|nr:hypothetical protein [Erwinia sp. MMLR14_017]MDW8845237.1 hypothetical protein [Erwinia sp. MMLR14_017]